MTSMPDLTARAQCCIAGALIAVAIGGSVSARAQNVDTSAYPNRPIHIVVPFPAGGPTDILSRIVAKEMTASWGRSEEHTSELQSRRDLVCRLLLEKKKKKTKPTYSEKKKKKKQNQK